MTPSLFTRFCALTLGLALTQVGQATALYEVIQIGNWPGTSQGLPMAINNRNVVLGNSWAGTENVPWLYTEATGMSGFGFGGATELTVRDLNNFGQATGINSGWNSAIRAIPGQVIGWGIPNGYVKTEGWGINDQGAIVGWATNANHVARAYRFNTDFTSTPLPTLNPNTDTQARRVNSAGTAVGMSDEKAVLWTSTNSLVNLHAMLPGAVRSFASDINEAGWVTGYFKTATDAARGFIFNFETGMTIFDPIQGDDFIISRAINSTGDTVGFSRRTESTGQLEGFLRRNGGSSVSLNSLIDPQSGWFLTEATDINDNGYIIGRGTFQGVQTNFMMKPVPEPSSMLAIGAGLSFFVRLRKKRPSS